MVSPRPSWLACGVDDDGCAAELGDADLEREPGAGARSCRTAPRPPRGPPAAVGRRRSAFSAAARSSTSACSAGREVVVAQEVARSDRPGHQIAPAAEAAPASRNAGRRRGTRRPAPRCSISGGASRITRSATALLTRNPAPRAAADTAAGHGAREHDAEQQPGAADAGDQRMAERLDRRWRSRLPTRCTWLEQPVAGDGVEHRQRGGAADRVAAEGGAVLAGLEQLGRRRRRRCTRRSAGRRRAPWPG